MAQFNPETWAQTQPHSFYSRWPRALHTKCDYCGIYLKDHAADVPADLDVSKHPYMAIKGGLPTAQWPVEASAAESGGTVKP